MAFRYVPFDDSYRVPADIHVSRGVRSGAILFTCGQLDMDGSGRAMHLGDRWAQTEGCMRRLYDVIGQAGMAPDDIVQLHVFYRSDAAEDEDAYAARLAGLAGGRHPPALVLTPVVSFPSPGLEVEIDAVAIASGTRDRASAGDGRAHAVRRGALIFASVSAPRHGADGAAAQATAAMADLAQALEALSADLADLCRLTLYVSAEDDGAHIVPAEAATAAAIAAPGPVYACVPLPRLAAPGELVRIEAVAMCGAEGDRAPRRHLGPAEHWTWPTALPYSQAVGCGPLVFVSAQLPLDRAGTVVHAGDLAAQTHAVMAHLGTALRTLGADFGRIAKIDSRFVARDALASWQMNVGIRSSYCIPPGPASTGIEVPRLSPAGALITVECTAFTEEDG